MGMQNILIIGAIVLVLGGLGWFTASNRSAVDNSMEKEDGTAMEKEGDAMMEKDNAAMSQKDAMKNDGLMMEKEEGAMMLKGSYEDYSPEKVAAAGDSTVLLFFHAEWCPICRPLDADIRANLGNIPENILILKVNYDKEIALRQKYGVTVQHTIVQVDSRGEQVKKWSQNTATLSSLLTQVN